MDFDEYFKKMCGGNIDDTNQKTFKVNGITTPFNKKELRWLKDQLEDCIEWDDGEAWQILQSCRRWQF